jgi:hypothetical protein
MNSNAATNSVAFLGPNFSPKLPKTRHKPVHDGLSVLKTLIIFPLCSAVISLLFLSTLQSRRVPAGRALVPGRYASFSKLYHPGDLMDPSARGVLIGLVTIIVICAVVLGGNYIW